MPARGLVYIGDDLLRKKSHPITRFDERLHRLIDDLWDTLEYADGAGISGVQIGVLRRIAVIDVGDGNRVELVNPEVLLQEGEQDGEEGCLSIPRERYKLKRPLKVRVKAAGRDGEPFEVEGEGMLARCLLHEIDHMDGVLFVDRLPDGARKLDEEDEG